MVPKSPIDPEAYRIAADALQRTRAFVRRELEKLHGKAWESKGIPEPVSGFLRGRRERETGIMWRLPEIVDLLDYAGFGNLYDVIAANAPVLQQFAFILPDPSLLRTRFLELDVVLNRVAFARPLSDVELEFLAGFAQRLARLDAGEGAAAAAPGKAPDDETYAIPPPEVTNERLAQALKKGDATTLMAALYQEVTASADAIWTSTNLPALRVWPRVSGSDWFRKRAASGDLAALTEFYTLLAEARELVDGGSSPGEVQDLLRRRKFAQVLMAMREVFKSSAKT